MFGLFLGSSSWGIRLASTPAPLEYATVSQIRTFHILDSWMFGFFLGSSSPDITSCWTLRIRNCLANPRNPRIGLLDVWTLLRAQQSVQRHPCSLLRIFDSLADPHNPHIGFLDVWTLLGEQQSGHNTPAHSSEYATVSQIRTIR